MTGGLPRGLISIEDNPALETEHEDEEDEKDVQPRLDVATIAKTWRIYSASRNALEADTGNRLENLFWRTWSNPNLLRNLHPSIFTDLVHHVGMGRGRVLLPRCLHAAIDAYAREEDESTPVTSGPPTATASPVQRNNTSASSTPLTHARQVSDSSVKSPQSILKKPSTDHSFEEPGAEVEGPSMPPNSQRDSAGSSSSHANSLSPTSSERPRMKRQTSGGGKKTSFVANTSARSKARPSVPRRKSSQGTVPQARDRQKEPLRSPIKISPKSPLKPPSGNEAFPQVTIANPARRGPMGPPPGLPLPPSDSKSAAFLLPSASSWQSVESTSPSRSAQEPVTQNSMPLVDPNFRKQFVEARSASQLNLVAAGLKMRKTGSVVRFAEDLPEFSKAKESAIGLGKRGSGAEARRSSLSASTPAIEDTDEEESEDEGLSMLPRTRSQLSMAIEERRRISGSQNLGPDPNDVAKYKAKGKEKREGKGKEEEDTEDELLKMGRMDGVTKAGGPRSRLPLRTSPQERYRSPTPPPIF